MQLKYIFLIVAVCAVSSGAYAQIIPVLTQTAPAGTVNNMNLLQEVATNSNGNYVTTFIPTIPYTDANAINTNSAASEVKQQVVYMDGSNQPFQSICRNVSTINGQPQHLIQINYTGTQNEQYGFLPYVSNNGDLQSQALQQQKIYYSGFYPNEGYTSFTKSVYGSTATERTVTTYAPGKSQVGQSHGTVVKMIANVANEVRIWDLNAQGLPVSTGYYAPNELTGDETILPQSPDGTNGNYAPRTKTFTDRDGRIILKMVADAYVEAYTQGPYITTYQCTYYVYDIKGNLVATIPPKAYKFFEDNGSFTSTVVNNLCFQNVYDVKGRIAGIRKPGEGGFTWAVYDRKDRVVMRQTPNETADNEWEITFFDLKNRVKATSIYKDNLNRDHNVWQTLIDNGTNNTNTSDLLFYLSTENGEKAYPHNGNPYTLNSIINNNQMMSYNWYDNYNVLPFVPTYTECTNKLGFTEISGTPESQVLSTRLQGMLTTSMIRVLRSPNASAANVGDWRIALNYYDDKGRVINTVTFTDDETDGAGKFNYDYAGMKYDFVNRLLISKHITFKHNVAAGQQGISHTELSKSIYDATTGSVTQTWHQVDGGAWSVLSKYEYDNMGRIKRKTLGNGGEVQDYTYNIRGQLTGINGEYAETGFKSGVCKTFGESIKYDYGFTNNRMDGKMAGVVWRGASATDMYAYGYDYYQNQSLKRADFRASISGGIWANQNVDYSVSNLTYDKNGNIASMKQRGVKPGVGPVDMDNLGYVYEDQSNRLQQVTDNNNNLAYYGAGDFKNGTNTGADYRYDANGNLVMDLNRNIQSFAYTRFNKPVIITQANGSTIEYSYDAAGGKLEEIVKDKVANTYKRTDYINNCVYENNTPLNNNGGEVQYMLTSEGRTVFNAQANPNIQEEFFVKDHLGNIRSVIGLSNLQTKQYLATYELASSNLENIVFDNIDALREVKPNPEASNTMAARLNGDDPQRRIGSSLLVHVMAGDKINVNVNSYYQDFENVENRNEVVAPEAMLKAVISTLTGGAGGFTGSESHNVKFVNDVFTTRNFSILNNIVEQHTDIARPRAYLNYVLFDEKMTIVKEASGAFQATGKGQWEMIGTSEPIEIPQNGYFAIYLSDGSRNPNCISCSDVYFDQLQFEVIKGKLLEENHYYPFGLPIQGLSSASASNYKENRHKYQGNELTKDLDLNLMDFQARQYDPQIGRFLGVDMMAAANGQDMFSPYAAMGNTPESNIDPNGLSPSNFCTLANPDGGDGNNYGFRGLGRTGGRATPDAWGTSSNPCGGGGDISDFMNLSSGAGFSAKATSKEDRIRFMEAAFNYTGKESFTVNFETDEGSCISDGGGEKEGSDGGGKDDDKKDENGYSKKGSLYKTPHGEKAVTPQEWAKHYEGKTWEEITTDNKGPDGDGYQRYFWGAIKFRLGPQVEWRYLKLDDGRILDMRHVFVVGMKSEFLGAVGEYAQFFTDKSSFNQTQDFVSNAAGSGFLQYLQQNSIYYNPRRSTQKFGDTHETSISMYFYNYIYGIKP
jgi:RHS repeat-associated protein